MIIFVWIFFNNANTVIFSVDIFSVMFEHISWNYWNHGASIACLEKKKKFCKNSYQLETGQLVSIAYKSRIQN